MTLLVLDVHRLDNFNKLYAFCKTLFDAILYKLSNLQCVGTHCIIIVDDSQDCVCIVLFADAI